MTGWFWVILVATFALIVTQYVVSVKVTGRPPADLYDALRDLTAPRREDA